MGQWSPTFFGSDSALDVWDHMARDLNLLPSNDEFLVTPQDWNEEDEAHIRENAAAIESWAEERLRLDRKAHTDGYRMSLVVLAASVGAEIPAQCRAEAVSLLAGHIRDLEARLGKNPALDGIGKLRSVEYQIALPILKSLEERTILTDPFGFLQYSGLMGSVTGDAGAWQSLRRELSDLPDIYKAGARRAFEAALARPDFKSRIESLLQSWDDILTWSERSALSVILAAIALMSAGAPLSDGFRALAKEAGAHDCNNSDGRASIRAAYLAALETYREGENMVFGEENLSQAFNRHKGGGLINR